MNQINQEVKAIDWAEIKAVLNTIVGLIQGVCDKLPAGNIKNILCGLISVIKIIIAMLPA